jgi:nitroimidazol reductase NimA-like FMN-containing flavoprotein (pyridoxamine 5'-phosphate oxidase superfamily)
MRETPGEMSELTTEESLAYLRANEVGRLAIVSDGQPMIFPVNYLLDGSYVVFRTDPGMKLDNAKLDRVAFEIDEIDPVSKEGWSVHISGIAREVTNAIDGASERERSLPLVPWVTGDKGHWVRIIQPHITGRRVRRTGVGQ